MCTRFYIFYSHKKGDKNMALTAEEKAKIARVSGSFMAGLCRGTATVLKGTGFILDKSTSATGEALHAIADGIETVGAVSSHACYNGANYMENKAEGYDLSGIRQEDLIRMMCGEEVIDAQPV